MTTQRQSNAVNLQFGMTLLSFEELTHKVEHLLERRLTREECTFIALVRESLKGDPLFKAKAGAA